MQSVFFFPIFLRYANVLNMKINLFSIDDFPISSHQYLCLCKRTWQFHQIEVYGSFADAYEEKIWTEKSSKQD